MFKSLILQGPTVPFPYLYDSEGKKIGLYLGDIVPNDGSPNPELNRPLAQVITSDGYMILIDWRNGGIIPPQSMTAVSGGTLSSGTVYEPQDCVGQAYTGAVSGSPVSSFRGGMVVSVGNGKLGKSGITKSIISFQSSINSAGKCYNVSAQDNRMVVPIEEFVDPSDFNLDDEMRFKKPLKIQMG